MRERTENFAETTLNGSINASTTSVVVTSASAFPSAGQFRITVGDDAEVMLVTGISGNTFTVTRAVEGPSAVSHLDGANVKLTLTRDGLRRYMRDWTNPLFDAIRPMQLLDASGSTLTASSFTNVNFTNGTKTDLTGGSILLEHATQSAANDYAAIVKSAPTAPWEVTCGFIPNLLNETGDFPSVGPVIRDNTTGELYAFRLLSRDAGTTIDVIKLTTPTSSSTAFLTFLNWTAPTVCWFQMEDDNTDLIFRFSADGLNFIEMGREARTTFLTPDEVGFAVNNFGNGVVEAQGTLVAWEEVEN